MINNNHLSEKAVEHGKWLFKQKCTFMLSVANPSQYPSDTLPEVAFAGRSNVGKSSLINGLFESKSVAKTSNTPGRTQQLNYFNVNSAFLLVDMPGYGFAKVPKHIADDWKRLIKDYIVSRSNLKRIYILVDARHGLKNNDLDFMSTLNEIGLSYQIILTKTDKINKDALSLLVENINEIIKKHGAAYPFVLMTSSKKRFGIDSVRAEIVQLCCLSNGE